MNDQISDKLDKAVEAIKADTPDNAEFEAAAARVRALLLNGESLKSESSNTDELPTQPDTGERRLNTLEEHIAAIPDYLAKKLSPAQTILFEEETRQSIPLRRALNEAKYTKQSAQRRARKSRPMGWIFSAAAAVLVAVSFTLIYPQLPSFNQSQLAQVEDINGTLYQVMEGRLQELTAGAWIDGHQELRSAQNTTAMLVLDDGSRIEVSPRAELQFTRRGRGNRIDVDRGKIIVTASQQGSGTLDVATNEFVVSVTGTIFEVGHGTNGSRVSVIEGEVHVHQDGNNTSVTPGEQFASRMGKTMFGIEDDITWSRNADEYVAMLREVAALQQNLQAVMDIEPRYSTRLLNLVPANTIVYGAVPNAPEKIAEIYTVIRDGMRQSDRLSRALEKVEAEEEFQHVENVMAWLEEVGDTLGDETVAALVLDQLSAETDLAPLILSEVDAEAFRASIESQLESLRETLADRNELATDDLDIQKEDIGINFIDDPAQAQPNQLNIWLVDDLLVASTSVDVLQSVQTAIASNGSGFIGSGLYTQLVNFYNNGAEYLGAVDLETIMALEESTDELQTIGVHNAQYLMVHHSSDSGRTNFTADLLFSGERSGVMSWLADPSPMGSLDFFSGGTAFVTAFVLREPSVIFDEIKQMTEQATGETWDSVDTQVVIAKELRDNFIATLGGEAAFGLDGPALPTPAWKIVVEVYDEILLQETIEQLIELANQYGELSNAVQITAADIGVYTGYRVQFTAAIDVGETAIEADISFNYAYVDGYLVASPNAALLERSINQYHSGIGLLAERQFQDLLPEGGYLDVSALSFNRIAALINDLTKSLPGFEFTDDQRDELQDLYRDEGRGVSMSSVIGSPDSIQFVHSGNSIFSMNISSIMSMQSIAGILIGEQQLIDFTSEIDILSEGDEENININIDENVNENL